MSHAMKRADQTDRAGWLHPDTPTARVVEVKPLPNDCLWVRFQDSTSGTVDLAQELWGPMCEPLTNPEVFNQARVDPELDTVVWPNGADLASEFLYHVAQQAPSTMV
jgi:hypothetical protein